MKEVTSRYRYVRARASHRRWRDPLYLLLVCSVMLIYLLIFLYLADTGWVSSSKCSDDALPVDVPLVRDGYSSRESYIHRVLLQDITTEATTTTMEEAENATDKPKPRPLYPRDLFTLSEKQHGAVVLHVIGMIYMFVALAIVCDEFFVPSLDVIIEKLNLEADVAGATFMAAGGSAPELFTSVIGVFVSFNDVGIGTIVGSAVFNILFVIGMCALFSKTVLCLTWWPLFRDCTFYSISLIILISFFMDNQIFWYEALVLLGVYFSYVGFMKFNARTEQFVKRILNKNKVTRQPGGTPAQQRKAATAPVLHSGSKFRHGLLQLMIHTIDPLHEDDGGAAVKYEQSQTIGDGDVAGPVDAKASEIHAIASLKVLLDATKAQNGNNPNHVADGQPISMTVAHTNAHADTQVTGRSTHETELTHLESMNSSEDTKNGTTGSTDSGLPPPATYDEAPGGLSAANNVSVRRPDSMAMEIRSRADTQVASQDAGENYVVTITTPGGSDAPQGPEEENTPIDMSWPKTTRKRINYVLIAPIMVPLYFTLPDTRKPRGKLFFPITFLGSICWIAVYSYLMVWWATMVGETIGIPPEVMGLTFLAAGTSIPDLITSVIVARKGFGDMAVSSSVGSNIFDVTVGLPLPWLIFGLVNLGEPVPVQSGGMVCSIIILFCMLLLVFLSILSFRWKMNKGLGVCMFLLYFVFVAVSLLFEYGFLNCFD